MLGITKYIHVHLQGKCKFSPPPLLYKSNKNKPPKGKNESSVKGKEMGLQIGRYTDLLFRKVVDKEIHLNPNNFKHRRCKYIFDVLRANKISISETQVRVKHEAIQAKTLLDGLGITDKGLPCVIELKTTQYTLTEHEIRYNQRCRIRPTLANGLPNSEFILHGLQAAFGALALRETYPECQKQIKAIVIVAASDGAKAYWVDDRLIDVVMFTGSKSNVSTAHALDLTTSRCLQHKVKFFAWPKTTTLKSLREGFIQRGFPVLKANTMATYFSSGFVYSDDTSFPKCMGVVGIHHSVQGKRTDLDKQTIQKRQLKQDAVKMFKKFKGKTSVYTFLVSPNTSTSSFEYVRATRPYNRKM